MKADKEYRAAKAATPEGETPKVPPPGNPPRHGNAKYGYPKQTAAPGFADTNELTSSPINLTPGSVVVFNPGGGGSTYQDLDGTTHIGTVLRVMKPRIQFMDTGVLTGDGTVADGEGGTADHSFRSGSLPPATTCAGWGRLRAPTNLSSAVEALAKARPLGFVRLVLVDESGDRKDKPLRVCFISELLHMRYPLSRFIWSLRKLPVDEGLVALWLVYAPQSKWGTALVSDPPPGKAPGALLKEGAGSLFLANVIRATSKSVSVYRHKADGPTNGWTKDFAGSKNPPALPPEGAQAYPVLLPGTKSRLEIWCAQHVNFSKSFTHFSGATGIAGPTSIDVPFFRST